MKKDRRKMDEFIEPALFGFGDIDDWDHEDDDE